MCSNMHFGIELSRAALREGVNLIPILSDLLAMTYKGRRSHVRVTSKFGAGSAQIFDNKRGRILKNDLHHNPLFSTTSETPFCPSKRHLAKSSLTFPPFCLFEIVAPAMGSLFCSRRHHRP